MRFEAPNAEAVRDLLYEGGFVPFTDMECYLVTPEVVVRGHRVFNRSITVCGRDRVAGGF